MTSVIYSTCWDSLLVRAPDLRLKGCEFKSQQEQRENFLLQSRLCVITLIRCPFHPHVTAISCTLIPLFIPGSVHSGLMSWDDCGQMSPDKLSVSLFLDIPKQCLDSGIVSPLWLCWVNGVCMFRCNLPPALLAEWLGSFKCHCGNMGVERMLNKSQHTNLILKKKILLRCSCWDSNLQLFDHKSCVLTNKLSQPFIVFYS